MPDSPLTELRHRLATGDADPVRIAEAALVRANGNASRNTYLWRDEQRTLAEAADLPRRFPDPARRPALYGIPVSLKDCFDLAGTPTSAGSKFYAEHNGIAAADSWVSARLRDQGALLTGKTHLHQLAYGITGENRDYGDCVQPRNPAWLTGGSSSGACASVQEGSALAAIGTDTGGSVRVPAALCGLAGYRSSLGTGSWAGGAHLAASFDTIGWLFRDLRDAPLLAEALFGIDASGPAPAKPRIGSIDDSFIDDSEPQVKSMFAACKRDLIQLGAHIDTFEAPFWAESMDIFAPIQAHEAAALHRGHFAHFEKPIADRLAWGESIAVDEIARLRARHTAFNLQMDALFAKFDFLVVPCAPVSALPAGADHSEARRIILRYTTPMSLAGVPVVTLPRAQGGVQLIAQRGHDAALLRYAVSTAAQSS
jgi:Asp-tRNA(Asn)/Glu-tRNA(Gln) amidotransferase A subunit family amidase